MSAPDGLLYLVPFGRLKLPDGRYWQQRQEVRLLQTGRDLIRPRPDRSPRGLLALGGIDFDAGDAPTKADSAANSAFLSQTDVATLAIARTRAKDTFRDGFKALLASKDEAEQVTRWYQRLRKDEPAEAWLGAAASEGRLKALDRPPRVLHLATHGFYPPDDGRPPMLLSGVALAGANRALAGQEANGILYSLEAASLNLDDTELVVLSACETAKGHLDYSEGVYGLARALRIAGARRVLMTLWRLNDGEARDFMISFYKNWLGQEHSDPAKALWATQLAYINHENYALRDPRVWAPYVLIE